MIATVRATAGQPPCPSGAADRGTRARRTSRAPSRGPAAYSRPGRRVMAAPLVGSAVAATSSVAVIRCSLFVRRRRAGWHCAECAFGHTLADPDAHSARNGARVSAAVSSAGHPGAAGVGGGGGGEGGDARPGDDRDAELAQGEADRVLLERPDPAGGV